ncbi:response regulator [Streptomyces xanthophaeus]
MTPDEVLSESERLALLGLDTPSGPPKCLVVESRPDVALYLKEKGFEVVGVRNGAEALDTLRNDPLIALVIFALPDTEARELVGKIRDGERAGMDIIWIADGTDVSESVDVMHLGIKDFLPKPLDLERLESLVKTSLRA